MNNTYKPDLQLDQPGDGRIRQSLTTFYKRSDGVIVEDTVERVFFKKDYVDSHSSKPLGGVNE